MRSKRLLTAIFSLSILHLPLSVITASPVQAALSQDVVSKVFKDASPSLVVVQFTWASEVRKIELTAAGVVVGEDGTVVTALTTINPQFPDAQLTDFKIIIPHDDKDDEEITAEFVGRDERYGLAYIRAKDKHEWKPLKFESSDVEVGGSVFSIGMLPKGGGFKPYLAEGTVGAHINDAVPQVLVMGALAPVQSPVFNEKGQAVGLVSIAQGQPTYLSTGNKDFDDRTMLAAITNPPRFFVPASDFLPSLSDPPKAGEPLKLAYLGVREMEGLAKDVADYYGLADKPAIQFGSIVDGTPAAKAGLKRGAIITQLNGKPLQRGSEVADLPGIFGRQISRMKPGEKVTLTVLTAKDKPTEDVVVTLGERPKRANLAERFYAEDLGFAVRELVFDDTYDRKLREGETGVVVTVVRPQSAAQTARLEGDEMVMQMNGKPVADLKQFKEDYDAFRKDKPKEAVVLVIKKEGKDDTIRIEPPQ